LQVSPVPHERAAVLAAIKAKLFEWPPDGQPALTAAPRDGARIERPGRENGSAGAELENMRGLEEDVARAQYFCLRTCCIHYFEHSRVRFDERRGLSESEHAPRFRRIVRDIIVVLLFAKIRAAECATVSVLRATGLTIDHLDRREGRDVKRTAANGIGAFSNARVRRAPAV
jgi:hypothetical protein